MRFVARTAVIIKLAVASALAQQIAATGGTANPQQPAPLPTEPFKAGEKPEIQLIPTMPVLPGDLPLLPGELPMRPALEEKPRESPRYKLHLAEDAMQPVLPPLVESAGRQFAGGLSEGSW